MPRMFSTRSSVLSLTRTRQPLFFVCLAVGACLTPLLWQHGHAQAVRPPAPSATQAIGKSSWGVEDPLARLLPIDSYSGPLNGTLSMTGARDEVTDEQLVLLAGPQPMTGVELTFSDLRGPHTGKVFAGISRMLLHGRLVGSVSTRKPYYPTRYVGLWPDPLLPLVPFDVAPAGRAFIWIDLHIPADAPAGQYRGIVTVTSKTAPPLHVPLSLHVWGFTLPRQNHLRTAFGAQGQGQQIPSLSAIYNNMLAHRITPLFSLAGARRLPPAAPGRPENWDWMDFDTSMTARLAQGMTGFTAHLDQNNPPADVWQAHLAAKGWLPLAYTYIADEPVSGQLAGINDQLGQVKRQAPGIANLLTARGYPASLTNVDIWCPNIVYFDPVRSQQEQARGRQSWWYPAYPTQHPAINVWTDYPALDCRIWPWMTWKYNLDGMLYWSVCSLQNTPDPLHQAPAFFGGDGAANGDGQFLYPGPGGQPLDSIRWEALRDGMQDYEVFCLLEAGAGELRAAHREDALVAQSQTLLSIRSSVLSSYQQYSPDPRNLLAAREEMSRTVERIVHALGHNPRITARPQGCPPHRRAASRRAGRAAKTQYYSLKPGSVFADARLHPHQQRATHLCHHLPLHPSLLRDIHHPRLTIFGWCAPMKSGQDRGLKSMVKY